MMKITVVIPTCDRLKLTQKTVESFLRHNDRANYDIYYGDDASKDQSTHEYMASQNIPCLVKHTKRKGCSPTSDALIQAAALQNDNKLILYIQNDCETIRTIPLQVIEEIFKIPNVVTVRLYGLHKNNTIPGGNPVSTTHHGKPGLPKVKWKPLTIHGESLEIGDIHWAFNPSINRKDVLTKIVTGVQSEADAIKKAVRIGILTVRFMNNITNHIGYDQSTPNGIYGKPYRDKHS